MEEKDKKRLREMELDMKDLREIVAKMASIICKSNPGPGGDVRYLLDKEDFNKKSLTFREPYLEVKGFLQRGGRKK